MPDKDRTLIYIPKDGNYIEILGHRIDGFDSFEAFCEHLKKYAELEEMVNRLQAEINALIAGQETLQKYIAEKNTEIERLEYFNSANVASTIGLENKLKTAKAEAYKEFAEEYKDQIKNYTGIFTDDGFYVSLQAVLSAVDFIKEKLGGDING